MKRKLQYPVLVILLIIAVIVASGCGTDASSTAKSASNVTTEQELATDSGADASSDLAAGSTAEQSAGQATDAAGTAGEMQSSGAGSLKYDASAFLKGIPEWNGSPYCEVNGNRPDFAKNEIWTVTQESLDRLDSLGRCGAANSCIGLDGMPDKPRGNISEIHPTGWHSDSYDNVEGGKLYNRCHLIAHKLSGDDAVDRNLITGTSYMNRQGMLPFEDEIHEYVKATGNHVMYRVTPCFKGDELVARGVHMQAISVEDGGEGLAFNVFCYNVQPGIGIDYMTGDNWAENGNTGKSGKQTDQTQTDLQNEQTQQNNVVASEPDKNDSAASESDKTKSQTVTYILNTNTKKFHYKDCNSVKQMKDKNKKEVNATRAEIIAQGYDPCGNCHP